MGRCQTGEHSVSNVHSPITTHNALQNELLNKQCLLQTMVLHYCHHLKSIFCVLPFFFFSSICKINVSGLSAPCSHVPLLFQIRRNFTLMKYPFSPGQQGDGSCHHGRCHTGAGERAAALLHTRAAYPRAVGYDVRLHTAIPARQLLKKRKQNGGRKKKKRKKGDVDMYASQT